MYNMRDCPSTGLVEIGPWETDINNYNLSMQKYYSSGDTKSPNYKKAVSDGINLSNEVSKCFQQSNALLKTQTNMLLTEGSAIETTNDGLRQKVDDVHATSVQLYMDLLERYKYNVFVIVMYALGIVYLTGYIYMYILYPGVVGVSKYLYVVLKPTTRFTYGSAR